jgi:hypothetical protein
LSRTLLMHRAGDGDARRLRDALHARRNIHAIGLGIGHA